MIEARTKELAEFCDRAEAKDEKEHSDRCRRLVDRAASKVKGNGDLRTLAQVSSEASHTNR